MASTTTNDIRRAAGSLVVAGFDGLALDADLGDRLRRGECGGVILFRRNIDSLDQVSTLCSAVQGTRPAGDPPLFVSVDQEGGPVSRLRGLITDLPAMAELGAINDSQLCADVGEMVGVELSALGFNTNFAPVMDVNTRPENPIIGQRAFSADPDRAGQLAGAFALGLLVAGVVPCAKHFPGHGDTELDSHVDLPVLRFSRQRLDTVELLPFKRAIRAKLPLIMTGHLLVPALDPDHPATLSVPILRGLLRRKMGFTGVVVSDDLEMAAVAERYEMEEMVRLGIDAGVDLFLICRTAERQRRAFEALVRLAEGRSERRSRVLEAAQRVRALRHNYLAIMPPDARHLREVIRSPQHLALAARIAHRDQKE